MQVINSSHHGKLMFYISSASLITSIR